MKISTTTTKTVVVAPAEVAQLAGLDNPDQWNFPGSAEEVSFTVERAES